MDFENRYKNYSSAKLLDIINHADDYQPKAIEAAKKELSTREIEEESYAAIESEIGSPEKMGTESAILNNINIFFSNLTSTLKNLFNLKVKSTEIDIIRGISIGMLLFAVFSLLKTYKQLAFIGFNLEYSYDQIPTWIGGFLIPFLGAFFLWNLKETGWYISVAYLIYSMFTDGVSLVFKLINSQYFPIADIFSELPSLILVGILLYFSYSKRIIKFLKLEKMNIKIVTAISAIYSIWLCIKFIQHLNFLLYNN